MHRDPRIVSGIGDREHLHAILADLVAEFGAEAVLEATRTLGLLDLDSMTDPEARLRVAEWLCYNLPTSQGVTRES